MQMNIDGVAIVDIMNLRFDTSKKC